MEFGACLEARDAEEALQTILLTFVYQSLVPVRGSQVHEFMSRAPYLGPGDPEGSSKPRHGGAYS